MTARLHLVEGDEDALWYGSILLNQTEGFLRRFVAYPSEDASVAHTLWIFHTHLMGCWESTPRLGREISSWPFSLGVMNAEKVRSQM
jgi:hypothetical protein